MPILLLSNRPEIGLMSLRIIYTSGMERQLSQPAVAYGSSEKPLSPPGASNI